MKIKRDFITNSSSSSYVFCVPENFDINHYIEINKPIDTPEDFNLIVEYFLKNNYVNRNNYDYKSYEILMDLFEKFNIFGYDCSSDDGSLYLLYLKDIKTKIEGYKT